jgi:ATP-dependent RNA helicase DeaD
MEKSFKELGLSKSALEAVNSKGFEEPTEIQEKIIPLILETESDIIGQAQTGTGKTAAFALPIIDQIEEGRKKVSVIVLVPTRELAIQVAEEFNSLKGKKKIFVAPIYGGQSYDIQLRHIRKGLDVIVGTPGRVMDHLDRGSFAIDNLQYVILDEADEMLNMGFIEDIEHILSQTNKNKRTLMFSATMPDRIIQLTKKFMKNAEIIKTKKSGKTAELTDQIYYEVRESDKFETICRIIDTTEEFYGIVFCRTKADVDNLSSRLAERDYDADTLHGDISQSVREKILTKFRNKKVNVLIATDVAARGLDIYDLTHVINYSIPQDPESYLHRIGRTGRAGKKGKAITFVTPEEFRKLSFIKNITKTEIRKERVPKISEVITYKKERILNSVISILEGEIKEEYYILADELIKKREPKDIIAALIKFSYQSELEERSYAHINDLFDARKTDFKRDDRREKGRGGRERGDDRWERGSDRSEGGRDQRRGGKEQREGGRDRRERGSAQKERGSERRGGEKFKEDKGKARMFLAMGKKDDLDPNDLLKFLKKKTGITAERITGIQINDAFSFFNVPLKDADHVLETMNANSKKRLLVERAKAIK